MDLVALRVTLLLATGTSAVLFVIGLPLAYGLANWQWRGKWLVESLVALPIVLPPTVLGFYLLMATGPESAFGQFYAALSGNRRLPFTFEGILLGSVIMNLPFAVRPFMAAFAAVDRRLVEASWCLGESKWRTWWRIEVPLAWPGILAGLVLTFAHAMGEFGLVLMLGGKRPGITKTLSIAIYDDVQALDYASAGRTALFLVFFAWSVLCLTTFLQRRR